MRVVNSLNYKGYVGTFAYDEDADSFHGRVVGLRDVITFEGRSVEQLKKALADSVEDYLEFCRTRGEEPERPLSGKFVLRLDPSLHRAVAIAAEREGKSLNTWVKEQLQEAVTE
jgi:predicted HicB family RNase H-like nuclease